LSGKRLKSLDSKSTLQKAAPEAEKCRKQGYFTDADAQHKYEAHSGNAQVISLNSNL